MTKETGPEGPTSPLADVGEPLLWNPLPQAAEWLTKRLGRTIDARVLIDCIIKTRTSADDYTKPTIIKVLLPRELNYANIAMPGHPDIEALELASKHVDMCKQFGNLSNRMAYLGVVFPTVSALTASELSELLLYGTKTVAIVRGLQTPRPYKPLPGNAYGTPGEGYTEHDRLCNESEYVWIVPWGTGHTATIESCGINRSDLQALGDALTAPRAVEAVSPAPVTPDPAIPWIETPVMARCLSGFGGWDAGAWRDTLGDPPKWMQGSNMLRRGAQGSRANLWQPVLLIDATIQKRPDAKTTVDSARKRFNTSATLKPWLDAWDEHAAMMYPTD